MHTGWRLDWFKLMLLRKLKEQQGQDLLIFRRLSTSSSLFNQLVLSSILKAMKEDKAQSLTFQVLLIT